MSTVFLVAEIYTAFVVLVVLVMAAWIAVEVVGESLDERARRRQWQHINAATTDFRRELDSVDLAEEMRRVGRAA